MEFDSDGALVEQISYIAAITKQSSELQRLQLRTFFPALHLPVCVPAVHEFSRARAFPDWQPIRRVRLCDVCAVIRNFSPISLARIWTRDPMRSWQTR